MWEVGLRGGQEKRRGKGQGGLRNWSSGRGRGKTADFGFVPWMVMKELDEGTEPGGLGFRGFLEALSDYEL